MQQSLRKGRDKAPDDFLKKRHKLKTIGIRLTELDMERLSRAVEACRKRTGVHLRGDATWVRAIILEAIEDEIGPAK